MFDCCIVEGFWESLQSLQTLSLQGLSGLSGLPAWQGLAHSIDSLKGARSEDSLDAKSIPTSPDKGAQTHTYWYITQTMGLRWKCASQAVGAYIAETYDALGFSVLLDNSLIRV